MRYFDAYLIRHFTDYAAEKWIGKMSVSDPEKEEYWGVYEGKSPSIPLCERGRFEGEAEAKEMDAGGLRQMNACPAS